MTYYVKIRNSPTSIRATDDNDNSDGYTLCSNRATATRYATKRAAECFINRIHLRHNWAGRCLEAVKDTP